MPKARSYKNEPFSSFEKQSFSVMKDDFVHEKLLTLKTNIDSDKGGVNLKQSLNQKGEALTSTGQTKLWFYFRNNYSLYTKFETNAITLAYDHGIIKRNNKNFNCYGSIQTNRKINENLLRVGVQTFSVEGNWSANNMLQFNQKDNSLQLFSKSYTNKNNWFFNNYQTVDLTGKAFRQSAFLLSYKKPADATKEYSARVEIAGFKNVQEFKRSLCEQSKVTLNYVNSKKGNYAHGIEFSTKVGEVCQLKNNLLSKLSTAVEVKLPQQNSSFKLRLSGNFAAAFSLKHSLGSFGTYTWGAELSDLGAKNNVRFGVQVDLNL